ncbi:MAG: hypothetical protein U1B83_03065 [Candidatus Cloacimonadaceae bacterium]|nr:hypothetical protein [Actinomycetota bacterium]MDZ4181833.1 hypothetical protein [Candidatus Cloacimonadaceae bacterium]
MKTVKWIIGLVVLAFLAHFAFGLIRDANLSRATHGVSSAVKRQIDATWLRGNEEIDRIKVKSVEEISYEVVDKAYGISRGEYRIVGKYKSTAPGAKWEDFEISPMLEITLGGATGRKTTVRLQ